MFRNRPEYRFTGRIHEQIAQHLPGLRARADRPDAVRIEHYGYLGVVRDAKEKSRRNIELLRAQTAESAADPFLHFNLGSEYAAAGDPRYAVAELERAWSLLEAAGSVTSREWTPRLILALVKTYGSPGGRRRRCSCAQDGLELFPDFTDLVLEQAIIRRAWRRDRSRALTAAAWSSAMRPTARPDRRLGHLPAAARAWPSCSWPGAGRRAPASCCTGPWSTIPASSRGAPRTPGARLARAMTRPTWCRARGAAGRVSPPCATPWRARCARAALTPPAERVPPADRRGARRRGRARGAGGVAARPGRYAEAAAEAAVVVPESAFAALACRLELCGRIGAGDP